MVELRTPVSDRTRTEGSDCAAVDVTVHDDFDRMESLREEWDRFVETTCGDIFQTFDWCRIWWKHYGGRRRLRVLIFREKAKIIAVIPLFLDAIWVGPFRVVTAKLVGSDFGLVQYSPAIEKERMGEVARRLSEQLSLLHVDLAHIGPIAGLYGGFQEWRDALGSGVRHYRVKTRDGGVQTYFEFDGDFDAYLSSLSKDERKHIRQSYKSVASIPDVGPSPVVCQVVPEEDLHESFSAFVDMHQAHWQDAGRSGHFGDWPASAEFHREVAEVQQGVGRLRLMRIAAENATLGYEYVYRCGCTYFALLVARRDSPKSGGNSLGRVIFCEQVKQALGEGVRHIDSMRGRYEHKLKLGGRLYPIRSIVLVSTARYASFKAHLYLAMSKWINLLYYKLWYCRILPRLKVKNRSLWRTWIRTRL
ncbi:MAG: GNAT family N-acetyltransferase [Phycisphaerae bacterium]|nr:GNAT family N-acetyltransferase [Phycisphaerae bacterium]